MASFALPRLYAGVIDDARGLQRRRRAVFIVVAATATAAGLIATRAHTPPPPAPRFVPPTLVLARSPFMGVAVCPGAASQVCARIGLAVWLRAPAVAVSATIAGHQLRLDSWGARPYVVSGQRARTMFVGYLEPVSLVTSLHISRGPPADWPTANYPAPLVRLRIDYGDGRLRATELRVPIEPGWG